jgi:hypothetical protein
MHRERSIRQMHVRLSGCKKLNHAHPNMVSVHDRTQESSSIYLLEVEGGWSTLARSLFFPGRWRS